MKKFISLSLLLVMLLSFASCGGQNSSDTTESTTEAKSESIAGKLIIDEIGGAEMTFDEVRNEYSENGVTAKKKYEGTPIIIIDKIKEINGDVMLANKIFDCQIVTENGAEIAGDFDVYDLKVGDMIRAKGYLYYYSFGTFEIYEINGHDVKVELYNE